MVEELVFGYNNNSNPEADFKDANLELKCTPLLLSKDGKYRIKERLICTMIDYFDIVETDFDHSHLIRKCRLMLLLFYLHVYDLSPVDYKFIFRVLWQLPEKDYLIIKHDYDIIADKVRRGEAHLLSEGDTVYLGAARKGQKGDSLQRQPFSTEGAKKRAFSLKPAYMKTILSLVSGTGTDNYSNYKSSKTKAFELVSVNDLKTKSFEQIIIDRFEPFVGKNYLQICKMLDISPYQSKSKYADVANLIASSGQSKKISRSEEFNKSGIILKTLRLSANGNPEECMSFKNIDYEEVYRNDQWEDSELYELFTGRFMFVVFRESTGRIQLNDKSGQLVDEPAYILEKVFFWTMPISDLNTAQSYWRNISHNVITDNISLHNFWRLGDKNKFHVRPKGTKQSYKNAAVNPSGGYADKYCYWFNAGYIKQIINSQQ